MSDRPHQWLPGVRDGNPILACLSCHRVWWPWQLKPKANCPGPDLAALAKPKEADDGRA